jgi:NTE family protein
MLALDLTRFEDGGLDGPARIIEKFGWYRGDAFLDWLGRQVEAKLGSPSATFAQLVATTHVDLNVVATEVSTQTTRVFSAGATPDMSVAEAVRMSMSIPFFFAAVRFQGEVYVDGGAAWNYPVEIFDGVDPNWTTLGLHLENAGPPPPPAHIGDLVDFAKYLYESVMAVQGDYFTRSQADRQRSVMINDLGIRATDFGIMLEQKNALIAEGRKATQAYLGTWGPPPPP